MKKKVRKYRSNRSAQFVLVVFLLVICLMIVNIAYLGITGKHLINGEDILGFSEALGNTTKTETIIAQRGTIYSSDEEVIASDVTKYKLIAYVSESRVDSNDEPAYVVDKEECAKKLSTIIGWDYSKILDRLNTEGAYQVEFGTYGNNLSSAVKEEIEALEITGLDFEEVTTRNYRFGNFASYEVGYIATSVENNVSTIIGQMGIEKVFDEELSGTNGTKVYLADSNGNELPNGTISETDAISGNDIYLTINSEIQTELDEQLESLYEELECTKATCAIMEADTGKILAISNYASFNPNDREFENFTDYFLNEAIEPGSVFKTFIYANAINDGVLDIDDTYTSGKFKWSSSVTIKDHNSGVGWGTISYEEGYLHSSNTAICNVITKFTNKASLIEDFEALGFFQSSEIDGISSASGVAGFDDSDEIELELVTTGFGQGSTATGLQLLRAYSVFANDGKTVEPYLVEKIVDGETGETIYQAETTYSSQIFSSETVQTMKDLMYGVVNDENGTGYLYHMDDIDLIGKTGTGQVVVDGAYSSSMYTHGFCGMAPYDDPQFVIVMWYQTETEDSSVRAEFIQTMCEVTMNQLNKEETTTVEVESYTLDSYINQSTSYVKSLLSSHDLKPIVIGNGSTVTDQYPSAKTVMTADSRVFIKTNGSKITMPSMKGWSRKEAEAWASMAGVTLEFKGTGTITSQSVSKGTELESGETITVKAE